MKHSKEKINIRQLCIFYFIYSLSIKLLSLPSILAQGSGNLAWMSALIGISFEIITVFIATLLLRLLKNKSLSMKIICILLIPPLAYGIWITCLELKKIAYDNLTTQINMTVFVLILVFIAFFFATRKARSCFRSAEILWTLGILGVIIAVIPALYDLNPDFNSLLNGDYSTVLTAALPTLIYFESASFILIFGLDSSRSKKDLIKINITSIISGFAFVIFIILFILLFGSVAGYKTSALVDFTTASSFITNTGSLDWFITSSILAMLVLRLSACVTAITTVIKNMGGKQ